MFWSPAKPDFKLRTIFRRMRTFSGQRYFNAAVTKKFRLSGIEARQSRIMGHAIRSSRR
jgi:hypothetical protein